MKGKELIEFITENHLEEMPVMVFSSEKWAWIEASSAFTHGTDIKIDAKYISREFGEKLRNEVEKINSTFRKEYE